VLCICPADLRTDDGTCLMHGTSVPAGHIAAPVPSRGPAGDLTWLKPSALLIRANAELCRRSLAEYLRQSWAALEEIPLEWNWHLDAICMHVQWQVEGWESRKTVADMLRLGWFVQQNVLINVPPGTMKSRIVSVVAFTWAWTRAPQMKVLALSSNPEVAIRDASLARDLIESAWYQAHFVETLPMPRDPKRPRVGERWELRKDKDAITKFGNTIGGERQSKGFTVKVTGSKADWIIVDDPHDAAEVYSEVMRDRVKFKWDNAIQNRMNDLRRGIRTGVMQRVHDLDWAGHLLRQGGWVHVNIPMEFVAKRRCVTPIWEDPRQEEGEVIHAARFTPAVLAEAKRKGSLYYAAQFQQEPLGLEGNLFKLRWWRWWRPDGTARVGQLPRPDGCNDSEARPLPKLDWIVMSVDASFKKTEEGSRVSILVIGGHRADRYVLDNDTRAMTFMETVAAIKRMKAKWPLALRILIEDKANGPAIVNTLQSEIPGVIEVKPEGGKESRAAAVSPSVESGNVYLPEGADWLSGEIDFLGELAKFPQGDKDDQVDAFSQALIFMTQGADVSRFLMLAGA
jgi:predicted phage terminase large subunit-like protein